MSRPSPEEFANEGLRLITAANPRLLDLGLWTDLVGSIFRDASGSDKVCQTSSRLGAAMVRQAATIESVVNEFSLVRCILEDLLAKDGTSESARKTWEVVRGNLDRALASAVSGYAQLQTTEARRDSVTGLPNRAAFDACLLEEIERAKRYRRKFSLVLFDIDHFKNINDRLGHLAGDLTLAEVGRLLTRTLRRSDQVFRFGGDEFAAICLESGEHGIISVLARVEEDLGDLKISCGVASFPSESNEAVGLVRLADERLYECKRIHHAKVT